MSTTNGLVIVNKPRGMTSYDVIRRLKKQLHTTKLGHSGTLDPLASGVLVVGVNRGTKFLKLLNHNHKRYRATVEINKVSPTLDCDGDVCIVDNAVLCNDDIISETLMSFLGTSNQIPPQFSAKKINGKRAYDLARDGVNVELKPITITVDDIKLLTTTATTFTFEVSVSHGTYIRSLIQDILAQLQFEGIMIDLIRLTNNGFSINEATDLDNITIDDVIDLDTYIKNHYPVYVTTDKHIINGGQIPKQDYQTPCCFVTTTGDIIGIYDEYQLNMIKPIFMN